MCHQGYELYGSDRMFLLSAKAMAEKYSYNNITIDLPQQGKLYDKFIEQKFNITTKNGWILRKKNFRKSIKSGLAGFGGGLKKAQQIYKNHDIIYINTLVVLNLIIMGIFSRKQKIIHVHEVLTSPLLRVFYSTLITLSRANMIFVSEIARSKLFLPFNKCKVIHNALATEVFPQDKELDNTRNFLILGRIDPKKGHNTALEALSKLDGNFKLRIVGGVFEGQEHFKNQIIDQTKELGLQNNVEFHDFTTDTAQHYNWADVVIMPSTYPESFGLIAVEAFAYKKLIIASNLGGLKEIIAHDKDGLLFKPSDTNELNQCLTKSFDKKEYHRLITAGNAKYQEYYKTENYLNNLQELTFC